MWLLYWHTCVGSRVHAEKRVCAIRRRTRVATSRGFPKAPYCTNHTTNSAGRLACALHDAAPQGANLGQLRNFWNHRLAEGVFNWHPKSRSMVAIRGVTAPPPAPPMMPPIRPARCKGHSRFRTLRNQLCLMAPHASEPAHLCLVR